MLFSNDRSRIRIINTEEDRSMTPTKHTVQGKTYEVWSDFIQRATYAKSEDGTIKKLCGSGYISNDLTIRKAIACRYGLKSFRK